MNKILMLTLYPIAKYTIFGVILLIGLARILFEIAILRSDTPIEKESQK